MKLLNIFILLFSFILGNPINSYSQYSELSVAGGIANYWGDLNPDSVMANFDQSGLGLSLGYHYHFGNGLAVRGELGYYRVKNDDKFQEQLTKRQRNLSFNSKVISVGAQLEFHILELLSRSKEKKVISPYGLIGVGIFYFNPTTEYQGETIDLRPLGTEGQGRDGNPDIYKPFNVEIPFGGGLKFGLTESIAISIEGVMRYTFTDYLDDVSTLYPNYESLLDENGSLAAALSERVDEYLGEVEGSQNFRFEGIQRGSPDVKDYYSSVMVRLHFYLGRGLQSPFNLFKANKTLCPEF